jgi:hypothetical protein
MSKRTTIRVGNSVVHVFGNKVQPVTIKKFTPEECITASKVAILHSTLTMNMEDLKGTTFYSDRLLKTLDEYGKAKLEVAFKSEDGAVLADEVMMGINTIDWLLTTVYVIGKQPKEVQDRYQTELKDLLIRYGVTSALLL